MRFAVKDFVLFDLLSGGGGVVCGGGRGRGEGREGNGVGEWENGRTGGRGEEERWREEGGRRGFEG